MYGTLPPDAADSAMNAEEYVGIGAAPRLSGEGKVLEKMPGVSDPTGLARAEERASKTRALALFDLELRDTFEVGPFKGLPAIHRYRFEEIYDFAGTL